MMVGATCAFLFILVLNMCLLDVEGGDDEGSDDEGPEFLDPEEAEVGLDQTYNEWESRQGKKGKKGKKYKG